jgi:hypothetical protein
MVGIFYTHVDHDLHLILLPDRSQGVPGALGITIEEKCWTPTHNPCSVPYVYFCLLHTMSSV